MALTKIQTEQIADDAVGSAHIADNIALGGSPTTTTQSASDNSTKVATTAYVDTAYANLVDSSPATLNTLNELAAALGDDANFSTTVTNSIATKLPLAGGTMTGNLIVNAIVDADNFKINNAQGSDGQVLTSTGSGVAWETPSSFNADAAQTFNESGAAVDFRIEGDTEQNLFFVDGSADKIGIGTSSPATTLHVLQDSAKIQLESNGSDTGVQLILDGARTSNGTVGDIVFENAHDTVAMIRAERVGGNDDAADMSFYTQVTGGANAEKMRITSDGILYVGNDTDTQSILGRTAIGFVSGLSDYAYIGHLDVADSGGYALVQSSAGATFLNAEDGQDIRFLNHGSTSMTLDSLGNLHLGFAGDTWHGDYTAITAPNYSLVTDTAAGASKAVTLAYNAYIDSGNAWTYMNADEASYYQQYNGVHTFSTAPAGSANADITFTERMRIDSNGTVQIGSSTAHAAGAAVLHLHQPDATSNAYLHITQEDGGSTSSDGMSIGVVDGGANASIRLRENGFLATYTNNTERTRLTADGVLCIGDTTTYSGGHDAVSRMQLTGGGSVLAIRQSQVTDGSHRVVAVFTDNGGTYRGRITINNSSCSFTAASDYRLKENIETLPNGLDRLKQLKPVKFKWKEHDYTSEGFIAHEVQEIYPEAVVGEKDDAVMQSMDYGKITPLLVKAIQEQQTIIDDLKSRIETLEG